MLDVLIVCRFIAHRLNDHDHGTRGTVHADVEVAAFDRALARRAPFWERPNLNRVVFRS